MKHKNIPFSLDHKPPAMQMIRALLRKKASASHKKKYPQNKEGVALQDFGMTSLKRI
jgi:hypothetical protein